MYARYPHTGCSVAVEDGLGFRRYLNGAGVQVNGVQELLCLVSVVALGLEGGRQFRTFLQKMSGMSG